LFAFDSIGKKIEKYIFNKNDFERQKLETLKKQEVFLKNGKKINIKDVNINDIIVFKKNEIIQFDGIIENGKGFLDTSNINGESNPHFVKKNSNIISGTKVLSEKIFVKVKINFKNSTLNKLILLIDKTSKVKSKIQNLANKIYKIFIPSVLFITIFI
jgi:P-type E1-E2 ATPase